VVNVAAATLLAPSQLESMAQVGLIQDEAYCAQ